MCPAVLLEVFLQLVTGPAEFCVKRVFETPQPSQQTTCIPQALAAPLYDHDA